MAARPVLIVKTGTTVPAVAEKRREDFDTWITAGLGIAPERVLVANVYLDDTLPAWTSVAAVVITGSSAMVSDRAPWSERTASWLRDTVERGTPVLGICYGHQLLAHAFGGKVENNPRGRNIGTIDVELTGEAASASWFAPLGARLHVPVSHYQSVTILPDGARRLASAARDPNHAFAIGERAFGVQFHPEFDADIVRGYIASRREQLVAEGLDPEQLAATATDSPHGRQLLRRFAELFIPA